MKTGLILTGGGAKANVELAKRAEAAGFESVFGTEFFNQHGFAGLGAIAQATGRVRIGTAIANAFTRSPMLHATAAMDLDELSGGRMVLGLGSGTRRMNEDWFGMPFSKPATRMKELVRLLRAAFEAASGMGFRFEGDFWKISIPVFHRSGARPDLPIWVAAVNPPMIRAAGSVADGLVGHPVATRRWHRERTLPGLREAENEAGRPEGACRLVDYVLTSLHRDRAVAVRNAKKQIGFYFTVKVYHSILELHGLPDVAAACRKALATFDVGAMADAIPDALVDEIGVVGTPDEARDRLEAWKEITDEPLLYAPTVGVDPAEVRENLDNVFDVFGSS